MTETMHPACGRAWIELDAGALHQNLKWFRKRAQNKQIIPVLKANAYGYGAGEILEILKDTDTQMIACACTEEAVFFRTHGWTGDILILGGTFASDMALLEKYHLTQALVDPSYAEMLEESGVRCDVHIAVDTGMHRIGFDPEDVSSIEAVFASGRLRVTGMFTHLCASDRKENRDFTMKQICRMNALTECLRTCGYDPGLVHISATYGIVNYPDIQEDGARLGIGMFGVLNNEEDCRKYRRVLHPVLSLHARIASVRKLRAGEYAGYAMAYQAEKDSTIAVISIGYGDGLPRDFSEHGAYVLVRGKKARLIGRICTDQALIDVTGIGAMPNDTVTLIGRDEKEEITVGMWAEWEDTITIDVLTRLSGRPQRIIKTAAGVN